MRTRDPGATLYRLIGSGSTPPTKGICNPNGSRYSHGIRYCAKRPHMAASAPYQIDENAQLEYWICIQYLKRVTPNEQCSHHRPISQFDYRAAVLQLSGSGRFSQSGPGPYGSAAFSG